MKKTLFYAAVAALALIGCSEKDVEPVKMQKEAAEFTLNVSVPVTATKSGETVDDSAVEDVQILVFDDDGLLEAYAQGGNETQLQLRCTAGTKNVVALVNAPDMSDIRSRTSLVAKSTDLLADNAPGRLVMEGEKELIISVGVESYEVTVPVRRKVAKVYLGSVDLDYSVDHYKYRTFTIDAVYLINVVGNKYYLSDTEPYLWYNKLMAEDSGKVPMLYDKLTTPLTVHPDIAYTGTHVFYCYPNSSADSSHPAWAPRSTRFVVEATLDGNKCYYPVTMPVIAQNKAYKVNLVIKRPGSDSPDIPVQTYWGDGNVEVKDWEEVITVDKEL